MKRILTLVVTILIILPVSGQTKSKRDIFYMQFKPQNREFYLEGNDKEINALFDFIDKNITKILNGEYRLIVESYCASFQTARQNVVVAQNRGSQVKSYFKVKRNLPEDVFSVSSFTSVYEDMTDIVLVKIEGLTPNKEVEVVEVIKYVEVEKPVPVPVVVETPVVDTPVVEVPVKEEKPLIVEEIIVIDDKVDPRMRRVSLRTNLLYDIAVTPNLGLGIKFGERVELVVNGAYADWTMNNREYAHRVYMGSPELRFYTRNLRWYGGLQYMYGDYHLKYNKVGRRGWMQAAGIVLGYRTHLSDAFKMDFSIGGGVAQLSYNEYTLDGSGNKNYFYKVKCYTPFPTQAGVTLVWEF